MCWGLYGEELTLVFESCAAKKLSMEAVTLWIRFSLLTESRHETGIHWHSFSKFMVRTGHRRKRLLPLRSGRPSREDRHGEILPKSHTSDLFSCHETRTMVPRQRRTWRKQPKWSTPDPWKPCSVNCKALKFKSSHPLRPSGCHGLSRQTLGRGHCDKGWRPSLCVQVPVRLSLSRISPVANRITLSHRHGCKDPLANWQSSFCTRREHCLKVCMKFSLWTYGDKGVMTVPPPKRSLTPRTSE